MSKVGMYFFWMRAYDCLPKTFQRSLSIAMIIKVPESDHFHHPGSWSEYSMGQALLLANDKFIVCMRNKLLLF